MGDCWLSIEGKIYDVSEFAHPGGKQILIDNSGRDATREFLDIGHKNADTFLKQLFIGDLVQSQQRDWSAVVEDQPEGTPIYYYVVGAVLLFVVLKIMEII
jgi:cytochrome b involved in lipid metabolism